MGEKLDIFKVLKRIDAFDLKYFNELEEDQKKTLSPYLLLQWMGGCRSEEQILRLNEFLNYSVFNLGKHPNLLYKLAMISSDGNKKKYNWIKKKGRSKKYSTTVGILRKYFECSSAVALGYIPLLNYGDVKEMACEMGEQDDTLKKIKKELG